MSNIAQSITLQISGDGYSNPGTSVGMLDGYSAGTGQTFYTVPITLNRIDAISIVIDSVGGTVVVVPQLCNDKIIGGQGEAVPNIAVNPVYNNYLVNWAPLYLHDRSTNTWIATKTVTSACAMLEDTIVTYKYLRLQVTVSSAATLSFKLIEKGVAP